MFANTNIKRMTEEMYSFYDSDKDADALNMAGEILSIDALNIDANYISALCYSKGFGTEKDIKKGIEFFNKIRKTNIRNDLYFQQQFASALEEDNCPDCLIWYFYAYNINGDQMSAYNIAKLLLNNSFMFGVPYEMRFELAMKYYEIAANAGDNMKISNLCRDSINIYKVKNKIILNEIQIQNNIYNFLNEKSK